MVERREFPDGVRVCITGGIYKKHGYCGEIPSVAATWSVRAWQEAALGVEDGEIRAHKSEGSAGPFARVRRVRHGRERLASAGFALPIFAEARTGENAEYGPVENGGKAIQEAARVLTRQEKDVMPEGVEHRRRVRLFLVFGLLPFTALIDGFGEERVKGRLARQRGKQVYGHLQAEVMGAPETGGSGVTA